MSKTGRDDPALPSGFFRIGMTQWGSWDRPDGSP